MAKVLFLGGRLDSVKQVSGSITEISGSVGWWDPTYSDTALNLGGSTMGVQLTDPASSPLLTNYAVGAGHSVFFHEVEVWQSNPGGVMRTFFDSAGYPWVRVDGNGNASYNSGTGPSPVWTNVGASAGTVPYNSYADFDLKLDISSSGTHTLLVAYNRVAVIGPVTFNAPGLTNISSVQVYGGNNTYGVSQIMVTEDWSTIGGHVTTTRPNGAGADADWSGTYMDVNEQVTNDSTVNQSTVAGQKQTYTMGNITVPTGYVVASVFNWLRAKNDGGVPSNIQSICRPGGTDNVSGDLNGILVTYSAVGARYDVNPDTSAPWTQAAWNAPVQMGFESAT